MRPLPLVISIALFASALGHAQSSSPAPQTAPKKTVQPISAEGVIPKLPPDLIPTAVDTSALLDTAQPAQRIAIRSIFLVVCPSEQSAGTGFLLDQGVIVTNEHVIRGCTSSDAYAISPENTRVGFTLLISDEGRDLAIAVPASPQKGGLHLSSEADPPPATQVSTWGYPFVFNGTSPLYSVGYVSGYRVNISQGRSSKRIILNAAINHGNSGGPLLLGKDNNVIGVVVATRLFFPPFVKQMLDELLKAPGAWYYGFTITQPNGQQVKISPSQWQIMGMLFDQFFQKTQTMIGEAISASELASMLDEHKKEIAPK